MHEEFRRILRESVSGSKEVYPSVRHVAKAAGISHTTLYHLMNGLEDPSVRLVQSLADAFPDRASQLWASFGYSPQSSHGNISPPSDGKPDGMSDYEWGGLWEGARAMARITGTPAEQIVAETLRTYMDNGTPTGPDPHG